MCRDLYSWTTMDRIVQDTDWIAKKVKDQANYTRARESNREEKTIFFWLRQELKKCKSMSIRFIRVKLVLSSQSSSFGLKLSTLVYFILRRTVGAENTSSCFQKSEWEYFWMLNRQLWHNPKIRRQEYYQVTTVKNGFIIGYWVQSIGTNVTNEKLSSQICFPFVVWQNIQRHHFN